jgi:hypothetical protein
MQSTYILAIKYIYSKHGSSLVMNMIISNWKDSDLTLHIQTSVTNKASERVSLQMIKFVQSYDIQPMYNLTTVNMHEVLKFMYLHSTNSLAVNYVNSKHHWRFVMNITFSN